MIAVPCVALAVIVAALILAAARRPRLRAALEGYLTQALKLGARLLRWPATDPMLALRAWAERFRALRIPPSTWVLATGDALVNWLADAAVLAVSILAVGAAVPWRDLLLVYLAGIGAQSLSLTPGGLAITEGAISVALVASGLRVGQAVAAAVLYRLVSFWLIAAVGWLILLVLRVRTPAAEAAPEPELEPSPGDTAAEATQPGAHELVLLHGQPGTAADWEAVMERLPAQLHAVAVDRPGYGSSQRQAAGFDANAQAVLDDLDERGVDTAVLVGHSWAGGVALQAAALAPHRVKAVVLLAGVGPGSVSIVDWLLAAPVFGPLSAQLMWRWTPWIARDQARLAEQAARQAAVPRRALLPAGLGAEGRRRGAALAGLPDRAARPVQRARRSGGRSPVDRRAGAAAGRPGRPDRSHHDRAAAGERASRRPPASRRARRPRSPEASSRRGRRRR